MGKIRTFRDNDDYVLKNSRWRRRNPRAKKDESQISPPSGDFLQQDEYERTQRVQELKDASFSLEKQLRDKVGIPIDKYDVSFDDFVEVYSPEIEEDPSVFSDFDDLLLDYIDDFGLFESDLDGNEDASGTSRMILWRLNTVCRTNDNPNLVAGIQHCVDDFLRDECVKFSIQSDISPQWTSEWSTYQGNVPTYRFEKQKEDYKSDIEKLMRVENVCGKRRFYILTDDDHDEGKDDARTAMCARIVPVISSDDKAYYLIQKTEKGSDGKSQERYYIYEKDRDKAVTITDFSSKNKIPSAVDEEKQKRIQSHINARNTHHRLEQIDADEDLSRLFGSIIATGGCGMEDETRMLLQATAAKRIMDEDLGDIKINPAFRTGREESEKNMDTINLLRGHSEKKERNLQLIETYATIIGNLSHVGQEEAPPETLNSWDVPGRLAKGLGKEVKAFGNSLVDRPIGTLLDSIGTISSTITGSRTIGNSINRSSEN